MPYPTLLIPFALAGAPLSVEMGDGVITGTDITPYEHSWQQCSLVEGVWTNGSTLTEKATVIGEHVLRIEQTASPQPGVTSRSTYFLDRASLAPIRSELRFVGPDGATMAERNWVFSADGYQAMISQNGQVIEKTGALSYKMYNAIVLGIALSTIDGWTKPVTMTGFMTQFDASYTLTATQAGMETGQLNNGDAAVRWIDVHWVHNETGDVYPAGPNASGGRYWITEQSQAGLPRVLRYKTDTYAIEYMPRYCPIDRG